MTGYLLRRFLQAIMVILGVILIVFVLGQLIPGGEARAVLGTKATPVSHRPLQPVERPQPAGLGPVLPLHPQSRCTATSATPTSTTKGYRRSSRSGCRKTLVLVGTATLVALVIAIPLGILQVVRRNTVDRLHPDRPVLHLLRHARRSSWAPS